LGAQCLSSKPLHTYSTLPKNLKAISSFVSVELIVIHESLKYRKTTFNGVTITKSIRHTENDADVERGFICPTAVSTLKEFLEYRLPDLAFVQLETVYLQLGRSALENGFVRWVEKYFQVIV
jgi:hypothetical protein